MSEREAFEHILASLHEAALDDTHWSTASALIDEALHVHGNSLGFGDIHSGEDIDFYFTGMFFHGQRNLDLEREYFEVYYPLDERVPLVRQLPDGQSAHISDLYSKDELRTSVVYNEFLNRAHAQNCISYRLDGPMGLSSVWFFHDPLKGDDWSSARLDLIRRLLPHIRQYVNVRQAVAGAGSLGASLTEMLDATGLGIIQLGLRGRIVEMNDRARDLLRTGDGLFDAHGFLFARKPEDNTNLQMLLKRALPPLGTQGISGSTIVKRASALPLALHVHPVARQDTDSRPWPVAALVLVMDPESRLRIDPAVTRVALDLTGMESRVAVLLAEGMSVGQIAAATGRKESTIRTHVKHIFTKHGLKRQVDLVRLVLALAGVPEPRD
ncbi:MAG: helix-turn-helix transcriptional regulator [Nitrospinae bacterium]|nr:helix-turn-helix transcriptional regulator [Nitrospinota bacterium]